MTSASERTCRQPLTRNFVPKLVLRNLPHRKMGTAFHPHERLVVGSGQIVRSIRSIRIRLPPRMASFSALFRYGELMIRSIVSGQPNGMSVP